MDHEEQLGLLTDCEDPLLIGVRHHSAALARAIPELLQAYQPDVVCIELPREFQSWFGWLGHDETKAPVALAASTKSGSDLCFYPFADFSPELAAIRWACQQDVELAAFDLPLAYRQGSFHRQDRPPQDHLLQQLYRRYQCQDVGTLWERMVETPSYTSSADSLRRAALLFGAALRINDEQPTPNDRRREQTMRSVLDRHQGTRRAAVVGAYHAAALLPAPWMWEPLDEVDVTEQEIVTALIPYAFAQFDERSGYPAGIRDPQWQQRSYECTTAPQLQQSIADFAVRVCRELRRAGHPINAADGKEVVRMVGDLARVRDLPVAGRGEFIEAIQTCLTQGELLGLGRAVANATEKVLIGDCSGQLPDTAPRSGLGPHIDAIFDQLSLPRDEKRMRLDPLRSRLDRARKVVFERLRLAGIPYAERDDTEGDALRENLTEVWDVQWQHSTSAMIELSAVRGATLAQVARAALVNPHRGHELTTRDQIDDLTAAAAAGFVDLVQTGITELLGPFFLHSASLAELTQAMELIQRIRAGHIAGLPSDEGAIWPPHVQVFQLSDDVELTPLLQSALGQVGGLSGSTELGDVVALLDLVLWFQQQDDHAFSLEAGRLLWLLRDMSQNGATLMQGAALAARMLLHDLELSQLSESLGGWLDAAVNASARKSLTERLQGLLLMARAKLLTAPDMLAGLQQRIAALEDATFLERLPALRRGFEIVSPAMREQLLKVMVQDLPQTTASIAAHVDPELIHRRLQADSLAKEAVQRFLPELAWVGLEGETPVDDFVADSVTKGQHLSLADRWRLMLGSGGQNMESPLARGAARALDELYGSLDRETRGDLLPGSIGAAGGQEEAYPTVREWSGDLLDLFGADVREEVLGTALAQGRAAALDELDPETVRPSVELLQDILSLKGAIPDTYTEKLRRLAKRIVAQLVEELAQRLRPALNGLSVARPTRRHTSKLDLPRTIRANLHTAQRNARGQLQLIPERLLFRQSVKRSLDWHLMFVTDVSGSMEPSVIYSAMMSAIFSGLPALTVSFFAFNTRVIDFSDHVDDPLSLLLEVQVGGGTNIARGLRYARQQMKNPTRTMVVLVTDFEEGFSTANLLAEVRALVATGANPLGLAALSDNGQPRYHQGIAEQVVRAGMPVAALSPLQLAQWVGDQLR